MHSHVHTGESADSQPGSFVSSAVSGILVLIVIAITGLTLAGLWYFRPDGSKKIESQQFAAPGATFPKGIIREIAERECAQLPGASGGLAGGDLPPSSAFTDSKSQKCGIAAVEMTDGPEKGQQQGVEIPPDIVRSGVGTKVILLRIPSTAKEPPNYSIYDQQRGQPLLWLTFAFLLIVALVARTRGLRAVIGLVVASLVIVFYLLPAILAGKNPIAVGLLACTVIMIVVLYLAHGFSSRTTTALLGTLFGLGLTAALGIFSVNFTRLSGLSGEENVALQGIGVNLDLRDLLICGIILAGMGVLNDVTITQSSSVWELRSVAPDLGRGALYLRAMKIGRDHIASTIYTIVFAYAGAALPVLLLIQLYNQPFKQVLTNQDIAEEIVRTLVSAIGLILAVPVTTGLAVLAATSAEKVPAQRNREPETPNPDPTHPLDLVDPETDLGTELSSDPPADALADEPLDQPLLVAADAAEVTPAPGTRMARRAEGDQRTKVDRRATDRRTGTDTRTAADKQRQGERRGGKERRSGRDRRVVGERRATRKRPVGRRQAKAALATYQGDPTVEAASAVSAEAPYPDSPPQGQSAEPAPMPDHSEYSYSAETGEYSYQSEPQSTVNHRLTPRRSSGEEFWE